MDVFTRFCALLGIRLKAKKTEVGRNITFPGLCGSFPGPDTDMSLRIDLPALKKRKWSSLIRQTLRSGSITHDRLESLTGRLSFSQTSIFGRFGRAMMQPLYRKIYAPYYSPALTPGDRLTLEWWGGLLPRVRPRVVSTQGRYPDWIIYSDAATTTGIMACVVFHRNDFLQSPRIRIARWVKAHPTWLGIFDDTNLIYGLETLALTMTIADPDLPLDNSLVTCYVDNNNTLCALVRSDSATLIISVLSRIFWAICAIRGIIPWLERVDSDFNISDLPTRNEELPINCDSTGQFSIEEILLQMVLEGFTSQLNGFFDPEELVGRIYTPSCSPPGETSLKGWFAPLAGP